MTTPAALIPALAARAAASSSEAAAIFAIAATSSRSAISPVLKDLVLSLQSAVAGTKVKLQKPSRRVLLARLRWVGRAIGSGGLIRRNISERRRGIRAPWF